MTRAPADIFVNMVPLHRLDSYTANEVMRVVKGIMADGDVTLAATIHSPSSHCYSLFDRVLILVDGGVVFDGPTGECKECIRNYSVKNLENRVVIALIRSFHRGTRRVWE